MGTKVNYGDTHHNSLTIIPTTDFGPIAQLVRAQP